MKQAVMTAPGQIVIHDVPHPTIQDHQILLRTRRIGVCGSDIHVWHGRHPYTGYPIVQGHEVSGIVAEVGRAVTGFAVGDPVTFMPQVTCGQCYPCRHGMEHICESLKVLGFQTNGAAQEYFPLDADKVLKLPAGLTLDQGAMIEPLSVAVHALRRGGGAAGKRVLVLGAGTIGNLTAQVARASGALDVMITDINNYRLALARRCGLGHVINTQEEELMAAIRRDFGPERADLILECVGVEATISQAIACARKGTTIVVVGVFGEKPRVDLGLVQDRELSLVGTLMYQRQDYEQAIALASSGKLQLEPLISDRFPFDRYTDAYRRIEEAAGRTMKVMIELD